MSLNAISRGIVTIPSETFPFVSGVSPAMRALERVISDVAPTDVPILLVGDSGTGKEVMALEVHRRSRHFSKPFVKCNCASLTPESLRLHVGNGGSSGRELTGRSGTTFFDDVGRLDVANQDIVLQFLSDDGSAPKEHRVPYRVISSTTSNLEEEMRAGQFREELYYRINAVCLRLPPLRQRQEDLPLLLDHFLKKYAASLERPQPQLSSAAMDFLLHHSWPGNVRELENVARRLVILGEELALSDMASADVPSAAGAQRGAEGNDRTNKARSLKAAAREASRNVERQLILDSLERTHWNRKRSARELQISYKALLYKLKQLDIDGAADVAQESAETPR